MMEKNKKHNLELPLAFSGAAQLLLYTRYGDPRESGFEQKWLQQWEIKEHFEWFPKAKICIHKHFRPYLEAALSEIFAMNLQSEIRTVDDDYTVRMIKGSTDVLSTHSWGVSIDMNALANPVGSNGIWSEPFLTVMRRHKIFCGQDWLGRKEPMHFSMVDG